MKRIDLVKLRKRAGISQRELAEMLQVRPSFLSAIENGRSRVPEEKMEKIKEIFELDSFDDYILEEGIDTNGHIPPHTHIMDQGDSLTNLLNHFHDLAHKNSHNEHSPEAEQRIDFLERRNDRLSVRLDELREEIDGLQKENFRLKELLLRNGISY